MSKDHILVGANGDGHHAKMLLKYANRHGLITGATGTGKTITLQTLAEGFSKAGVPVFLSDVKGDLQCLHKTGLEGKYIDPFQKRIDELAIEDYAPKGFPVKYWDCFGENGIPIRSTISEIGPVLLSRMLELNDTQEGVLNIAFRIADEQGLLLCDLKDLRSVLIHVADHASEISAEYGNVSKQSIAAIQRSLLTLENQGAAHFFGETALDLNDLIRTTYDGKGFINILSAVKLMNAPDLYSSFLLWLLSELYENLPEVGDSDKPKIIFFFDESHLLFDRAPKSLLDQVERVVRLIRSKGVGVFFVTQSPTDVPEDVLGQLANRVQHALRTYSPKDQKAVKVAADTFRENPKIDTFSAITALGVGEALVSFPDQKGVPLPVEQVKILPPESCTGASEQSALQDYIQHDDLYGKYKDVVDGESAYEILQKRIEQEKKIQAEAAAEEEKSSGGLLDGLFGGGKKSSGRQSVGEAMIKSVARNVASQVGRQIGRALIRGILGSLTK